ncbi:hypothetical protein VE00_10121 [Pseudogymnoascus sp. WSF 3629]|nr:hypothetical protein VE00_10121 [Pseudogymnoascus sp. WSF 3629]
MSELPGYSPYGVPPPEPASSTTSLATSLAASLAVPTPSIRSTTPPVFPSLPHFPDDQPRESLAGPVKTTSLSDMQHDYFRVTRVTNTTYSIALTTDPTPLYRIEVDPHIAADPAIQVFDLFNPLPLATARLHPAVATSQSCTRDPAGDNPKWRPLSLLHFSSIPLIVIPGMAPIERSVRWQHTTKYSTNLELWMRDPLFGISAGAAQTTVPRELLLARYGIEGVGFIADRVLEIRRGGGMEFELVVLVQAFAILEADRRKKARKGGK